MVVTVVTTPSTLSEHKLNYCSFLVLLKDKFSGNIDA